MHIHGRRILRAGLLPAGVLVLLLGAASAGWTQDRPKIFLEKKVFADTSEGKKSFYEVHTVEAGENLWTILHRKNPLSPAEYASLLKEFRRANPSVADPGKLMPGEKILIPSARILARERSVLEGKAVPQPVSRGDNLTKLLMRRGVSRGDLPRYLDAVKEINDSVHDVNRIFAGATILLPTAAYFEEPAEATAAASEGTATEAQGAAAREEKEGEPQREPPAVALSRDAPPVPGPEVAPPAKPGGELRAPSAPEAAAPAVVTAKEPAGAASARKEESTPPAPKPAYRGLLTDFIAGLGEKWADRGTLYLPVPSGGEVIINLEDFPVVRFSNGTHVLIDFRGALPQDVRALITQTWKNYRVVSMEGTSDAWEILHRLLQASGYHSVKEGRSRPLVIGEGISVTLPARWVVLRTAKSLLSGEVILVKEVPEKPSGDLSAVLRYADRVGIRALPLAVDPSALEGFLVGVDTPAAETEPPRLAVPPTELSALDFALDYLGLPKKEGERLRIGGKGDAFQLVIQPERTFEAGSRRYVVNTGSMAPALQTLVEGSGRTIFAIGKRETGQEIFRRLLRAAGIATEARRGFLISGGDNEGYSVRVTGEFVTSRDFVQGRKAKEVVFFGGRVHAATRALLHDLGVEVVEW